MKPEIPKQNSLGHELPNINSEEITEKLANLKKAKECLGGEDGHTNIEEVYRYFSKTGFNELNEKLIKAIVRKYIDIALDSIKKIPHEAVGSSNKENFDSLEIAFSPILHHTKKMAEMLEGLGYHDDVSTELIRFVALVDELTGNYYMAREFYTYISDLKGQGRTNELYNEFMGGPNKNMLSSEERDFLFEKKMQYLYDNVQSIKERLIEAAGVLAKKTNDLKVNSEGVLSEVRRAIDKELETLESK